MIVHNYRRVRWITGAASVLLLILSTGALGVAAYPADQGGGGNRALAAVSVAGSGNHQTVRPTAGVFTVNNTGDAPDAVPGNGVCETAPGNNICTLRAAIQEANALAGPSTILFNIAGSGVQTISPLTALPTITDTVTINGYNQPGSSPNTLIVGDNAVLNIAIDGSSSSGNGLSFAADISAGTSASNSLVQGLAIGAFSSYGISVSGVMSVTVNGNFIGTDVTGREPNGNGAGVQLSDATGTAVGGPSAAARNLISGNSGDGIQVSGNSTQNTIQNNYIGINSDGTGTISNGNNGVQLLDGSNNHVGTAGAGNLISGNGNNGIRMGQLAAGTHMLVNPDNNFVQGNSIGTTATGDSALPNSTYGVQISSANGNLIGGSNTGEGNLISGNGNNGIFIDIQSGGGSTNNTLRGNRIGTDSTGTTALANGGSGVVISGAAGTTIGGPNAGDGNLISGNSFSGVLINSGAFAAAAAPPPGRTVPPVRQPQGGPTGILQGNRIGTTATGSGALGNGGSGVSIIDVSNVQIGGPAQGAANTIAYNSGNGVTISLTDPSTTTAVGDSIRQNAIFSNTGLGIDLGNDGVTVNDPCDRDSGPNNLQNYPDLSAASSVGSNTQIIGSLEAMTSTTYILEFFSNPVCDPSGHGEGQTYLGTVTLTSGPTCGALPFNVTVAQAVTPGQFITAAATDANGNTSEFSACITVVGPTATPTATVTSTFTNTPTRTATSTATNTPTVTQTATPSVTPTSTPTTTLTNTPTLTSTPTTTPTITLTVTMTPTGTLSPSATPTLTPSNTATVPSATTITATPTGTPSVGTTLTAAPSNTAAATVTACSIQFSDVPRYSPFYVYIECLACRGIVTGYSDGTFRPYNAVTRAQVSKIVDLSAGFLEPVTGRHFTDVPPGDLFYPFIERLAERGLINGYDCGATNPQTGQSEPCDALNRPYFRPGNNVTRGQLAKMDANAAGYTDTPPPGTQSFADVTATNDNFYIYIERLARRGIISGYDCGTGQINTCSGLPETCDAARRPYYRSCAAITRGQSAKIVSNTFFPLDCAPGDAPILPGR